MYEIKNGILYKSGVPVIGLGQSYYPSYHTQKVPVPEDGDRYGEMVKDMKAMAEAGFNVCRTAALGNYGYDENETVVYNFDFIDSMLEEISKQGMASMIRAARLQHQHEGISGRKNDRPKREPDAFSLVLVCPVLCTPSRDPSG